MKEVWIYLGILFIVGQYVSPLTMGNGLTLVSDSVQLTKVPYDETGEPIENSPLLVEDVDYQLIINANNDGFDIQFLTAISYTITVTYTTTIKEELDTNTKQRLIQDQDYTLV